MSQITIYTPSGEITRWVDCLEQFHDMQPMPGENYVQGRVDANTHYIDVDPKSPVEKSRQPSPYHLFNYTTKQWQDPRTLDDLKAAQWTAIKQARSAAEYSGFTWDGSTFDSDAISQNRITGAVALAQMSSTFSIGWVLADNTVRTLNQSDMLAVGAALGAHVAAVFAKGVLLREVIAAAGTPAEIEAIAW
jgi:hypothetical protein